MVQLPSGRTVRGRSRRAPADPPADLSLVLLSRPLDDVAGEQRWVRWPDFRLPADRAGARAALREAWERAAQERVEVVCGGGVGRTGTALACLAVLDGVPADDAVRWVRERYHPRAVETPWQRRFVRAGGQGRPRAR